MVDENLVKTKIASIQKDLEELTRFKSLSFDEIAKDYDSHKIVERIIEVVINGAIDINQHIIAESDLGILPFDFRESYILLGKIGVYPEEFGKEIGRSTGLRNILVHQYRELDEKIFYESIGICLRQYYKYCEYILKFLKKDK